MLLLMGEAWAWPGEGAWRLGPGFTGREGLLGPCLRFRWCLDIQPDAAFRTGVLGGKHTLRSEMCHWWRSVFITSTLEENSWGVRIPCFCDWVHCINRCLFLFCVCLLFSGPVWPACAGVLWPHVFSSCWGSPRVIPSDEKGRLQGQWCLFLYCIVYSHHLEKSAPSACSDIFAWMSEVNILAMCFVGLVKFVFNI